MDDETYLSLKETGPDDTKEMKGFLEAWNELQRKRKEIKTHREAAKELSKKVDPATADVIRENAQHWAEAAGDYEALSYTFEELAKLADKPKVSLAAAKKAGTILKSLRERYGLTRYTPQGWGKTEAVLTEIMEGADSLGEVNAEAAVEFLDHGLEWDRQIRQTRYQGWVWGLDLPERAKIDNYQRLVNIIKEVARDGEDTGLTDRIHNRSNRRGDWKSLMEGTGKLLEETGCHLQDYFEHVKGKYRITGEYLGGPLDWLQYDSSYLNSLDRHFSQELSYADLGDELREGFKETFEKVRELRRACDETETGYTERAAAGLKELINKSIELGYAMSGYRSHMSKPGALEDLKGDLEKLSGSVEQYTSSFAAG